MKEKNISNIANHIYIIRNQKVMLDRDLAKLYGVEVKRLNEQVKRNKERFPDELMFQLNINELDELRSQIATAIGATNWNHMRRSLPYVFTEPGSFALSFVLKSKKYKEIEKRLTSLEKTRKNHSL